jgi:hypothetical protein
MSSYGARPIRRRRRRTKADMDVIRAALINTLAAENPMTVRQVFYALTTQGVIAKTEAEYKTVVRLTAEMRRAGELPFQWIADSTRWMRKPTTYSSAEQALRKMASTYRRALWDGHAARVEIWLEKDALAGALVEVTNEWDVPLMVTRGYPSMSFLHSAAEAIKACADEGQHTHIYYFGDRDPSGIDIDRAVVHGIGESLSALDDVVEGPARFEAGEVFHDYASFTRVAVTESQIEDWQLPTRPTKRNPHDHRAKRFEDDSVEVDAIPSRQLRELVTVCIEGHVDQHQLKVLQATEAEERRLFMEMVATFDGSSA